MSELDAIRDRLAAATPGPWRVPYPGCRAIEAYDDTVVVDTLNDGIGAGVCETADADFIAHAPEDVAILLAALDAALGEYKRIRQRIVEHLAGRIAVDFIMDCAMDGYAGFDVDAPLSSRDLDYGRVRAEQLLAGFNWEDHSDTLTAPLGGKL